MAAPPIWPVTTKPTTQAAIPVIFLTAKVQRGDVGRYVALGAVGAIPKPFDPMRLPSEIRGILGRAP